MLPYSDGTGRIILENEEFIQEKQAFPWQILPGSALKWIALITMVVDHTAMALINSVQYPQAYILMRSIGRLAFPIYCFLLVEGFYHTHSFFQYALSMFIFAVLSEIPYNLARGNLVFYPQKQNVFFTLFLGLLMMRLIEVKREDAAWRLIFLMAFCGIAQLVRCDYGMYGIMQVAVIYFCRNVRVVGDILVALLNFFIISL